MGATRHSIGTYSAGLFPLTNETKGARPIFLGAPLSDPYEGIPQHPRKHSVWRRAFARMLEKDVVKLSVTSQDYYGTLGVDRYSSDAQIKDAYRNKVKQYHPDLHPEDKIAPERIKDINQAYEVLSDPDKRKRYDAEEATRAARKKSESKGFRTPENSGSLDLGHMEDEFRRFWAEVSKGATSANKAEATTKKPLDTTALFERFMGFK